MHAQLNRLCLCMEGGFRRNSCQVNKRSPYNYLKASLSADHRVVPVQADLYWPYGYSYSFLKVYPTYLIY